MGKFDFDISDDFINQLKDLSRIDEIAPKMIDEAIPILQRNVISEMKKHKRTGDMIDSVKKTKAGKAATGAYFAAVRPTGKDRFGIRNMEKLVDAEYGTKNQNATPILTKALKDSESAVYAKMQEVFDREMGVDK